VLTRKLVANIGGGAGIRPNHNGMARIYYLGVATRNEIFGSSENREFFVKQKY